MLLTRRRLLAGLAAAPTVTFNPGMIASANGGLAQGRPAPPIAVTATSSGILTGPRGFTYGWAVLSNVSPWAATVTTAEGLKTILPYNADLVVPTAAGVPYVMSVFPGGLTAVPAGALTALQVDWYVAGGAPPAGTFPIALTSQAIAAALVAVAPSTTIIAQPAAGTEVTETFTVTARLLSVFVSLITSATAGARSPKLRLRTDAGFTVFEIPPPATIGPSSVAELNWFAGAAPQNFPDPNGSQILTIPMPAGLVVAPNWTLSTNTFPGLAATDQYGPMTVLLG